MGSHLTNFGHAVVIILIFVLIGGLPFIIASIYGSGVEGPQRPGTYDHINKVRERILLVGYGLYAVIALWYGTK